MLCYECEREDEFVEAVGVCPHCGVGLCPGHMIANQAATTPGGIRYGCHHHIPAPGSAEATEWVAKWRRHTESVNRAQIRRSA